MNAIARSLLLGPLSLRYADTYTCVERVRVRGNQC